MAATHATPPRDASRPQERTLLAVCQALIVTSNVVLISINALGALVGIASGMCCTAAVALHGFALLSAGNVTFGVYNACAQDYRFVAADAASAAFKSRAISLVLVLLGVGWSALYVGGTTLLTEACS